jgi:hypothetical protein
MKTLRQCDGNISSSYCNKCGQPAQNSSSFCGRLIEVDSNSVVQLVQSTNSPTKIVETYIVEHEPQGHGSAYFDTEILKIHLIGSGNYYLEDSKGRLSRMKKEIAEKLINQQ